MAVNKFLNIRVFRYIISVVIPIALIPIANIGTKEAKCSYVMVLMALFWMFEPIPLAVTSLFPVVFFPLLDIMSTGESTAPYMSATNMVFVAGLMMAIAIEHCNLHKRIALKILLVLGTSLKRLLLGFMISTAFLSMWISNTATAAMMVPILDAILTEIEKFSMVTEDDSRNTPMMIMENDNQEVKDSGKRTKSFTLAVVTRPDRLANHSNEKMSLLKKGLFLSVAYAANIGGTGTLIGTGPNLVLQGTLAKKYPGSSEITFASWMLYAIPGMLVCLALAWLFILFWFMRRSGASDSKETQKLIQTTLEEKFEELGPLTFHQGAVVVLFTLFILALFFRDPKFIPGWGPAIAKVAIKDATPAMAVALLLFFIPCRPMGLESSPALLDWKTVQQKMPWGLILLLGGGFSMAAGFQKSGLSEWVKHQLSGMQSLSALSLLIILTILTAGLTELTSNVTTASAFLPVVADLAVVLSVHPLYLMLPVALACSFAFMLPIATPPNAIVYEAAGMTTKDMAFPGFIMNLICCVVCIVSVLTLGQAMFSLNQLPEWTTTLSPTNSTFIPTISSLNFTDLQL